MKEFEKIKDQICFRVINRAANQEMLAKHPHKLVLDWAMIFYYKKDEGFKEGATILIREEDRKSWGVSTEQLYEIAKANSVKILPSTFRTIEQIIGDIAREENLPLVCDDEPKEQMYVITNEERYFGAGCVLYPEVLDKIYRKLKTAFFVLPSSIHECIIMPDTGTANAKNLSSLVTEMNEQFLELDEILSSKVYHFAGEGAELVMA